MDSRAKSTPSRQNPLNKSFGICATKSVSTLYEDEKKVRKNYRKKRNRLYKDASVIYNTLTSATTMFHFFAIRFFTVAALDIWNSLCVQSRSADSFESFKHTG